jgi:type II secretory pathway predicted ATPase ExeA/septal ring-binding cell division protein DamX
MENNSEQSIQAIFTGEIEKNLFFKGGGRGRLLDELAGAVTRGVPLLVLTGDEGSGKTVICRTLEGQVREENPVVFFSRTVESFEDVVKIIADAIGIEKTEITDGSSLRDVLKAIAGLLLRENIKLLIIFDEAENIYLATLERIRKMLGQMTEAGVHLHVLFSGRPSFLENFDQLVICDFKEVEEKHFQLEPLSPDETTNFIKECLRLLSGAASAKVPESDIVERITDISQGNFRMVKKLLQEFLVPQGDDTSFMVLLDTVATDESEVEPRWTWPSFSLKRLMDNISLRSLFPWFSGIACLLAVLFFVLRPARDGNDPIHPLQVPEKHDRPVADTVAEKDIIPATATEPADSNKLRPPAAKTGKKAQLKSTDQPELFPDKRIDTTVRKTVAEKKETRKGKKRLPQIILHKEPIVELHPSPFIKRRVGQKIKARKSTIKVRSRTEVQKGADGNGRLTPEQLYMARLAAGNAWRNGSRNNMYTVQLMALTARDAEENLKQMLAQDDYRKEAGNFFIFRKKSRPQTLLVFYGEYPTIAEARSQRKSIPSFLQKHKPYAISIKGAVAKVRK